MQRQCARFLFALIVILVCVGTARPVHAQFTYTKLHDFGDGSVPNDGATPQTSLIQGTDGNFYGTTTLGGSANKGTVFKVTPSGTVTILHSFGDGSVVNDGQQPNFKLLQGTDGNFYGTTAAGGAPIPAGGAQAGGTVGTVFKMTPAGVVTILHSFGPGCLTGDGAIPRTLTQTGDGTLYGGTQTAGIAAYPHGFGVEFSISPSGTYSILHVNKLADAAGTVGLIASPDGNLYGIAVNGGGSPYTTLIGLEYGGTFFKVTPSGQFTTLVDFPTSLADYVSPADFYLAEDGTFYFYTFAPPNGAAQLNAERPGGGSPTFGTYAQINTVGGPFIIDPVGNLYTSTDTGTDGQIEVATPSTTNSVAHAFTGTDGNNPNGLFLAKDGDLYGTTIAGGSANDGVIFKLHNASAYGPASEFEITPNYTDPNGVETGSPLSFTVTALDSDNRIAAGYTGTVQFSSNDPHAMLPVNSKLIDGVGTFEATFSISNTLTATDTVTPTITGSSPINVLSAKSFQVTTPSSVTPGVPFNVTVTALDAFGGVTTGYAGTVQITSSDPAATLPANAKLTNGVGTFSVTLRTQGYQDVIAVDTVTSTINGTGATYVPGPATSLTVSAASIVVKGVAFNVAVTALDSSGRTAAGYAGTVHITANQSGATLPADAKLTNGTGTFSVTLPTPGNATITATDTVTSSITGTTSTIRVALTQFGAGWQIVATPFTSVVASSVIAATSDGALAYSGVGYINWTTLKPGVGFWIDPLNGPGFLLDAPHNPRPTSVTLHKGWDIIGDPYLTAEPASSMTVNGKAFLSQSNLLAQVTYTFQPGDTAYETASGSEITFEPYVGYWVYAYAPCTVTFN